MAFEINHITLVGANLTRDAETRILQSGKSITSFGVAINRSVKDQSGEYVKETDYYTVEYWQCPEKLAALLTKGTKIAVDGDIAHHKYTDKSGTERMVIQVNARSVVLMQSKQAAPADDCYDGGY